jgi:hypothetical protein
MRSRAAITTSTRPARRCGVAALFDRWTIPAPGRPLFEAAAVDFNPHSAAKVDAPTNCAGRCCGGKDLTMPEAVTRATPKRYRHSDAVTDLMEFPTAGIP